MTPSLSRQPLGFALALYAFLTLLLIVRVPLGASPDEAAHWQYIDFVASNARLPVFAGQAPPSPGYEFHQPPLYYLLCAPLWALLPAGFENYAARLVSLICGALTLVCVWKAALHLLPNRREVAVLATFFAALWPLHIGVGASGGNDALAGLLCAAMFCVVARAFALGTSTKEVWQIGVLVALATLTKNTTLVVSAVSIAALFFAARHHGNARPLSASVQAAGIALVLCSPLLIRNFALYGDPLALSVFGDAARQVAPGPAAFAQGLGIDTFGYIRRALWVIFCTNWGFFGGPANAISSMRVFAPGGPSLTQIGWAPLMLLLAIVPFWSWLGARRLEPLEPFQKATVQTWAWAIMLVVLAWAQFLAQFFAGAQARYGHAALLPICILLALGWSGWNKRAIFVSSTILVATTLLVLTLFNVLVWRALN